MILVIGACASGKRTFASGLGYDACAMRDACESLDAPVVYNVQRLVSKCVDEAPLEDLGHDCPIAARLAQQLAHCEVVICTEVGGGIEPIESHQIVARAQTGRLTTMLAAQADCVVRMVCGIPVYLKGRPLQVVLMRHSLTPGNAERRYVGGATDEALSEEGEVLATSAGIISSVDAVYTSPLKRARQTASLCFPCAEQRVVEDLREMFFGDFEGRNYEEMSDDAAYRAWVEGNCEGRCPGGEMRSEFGARCQTAFRQVLDSVCREGADRVVVVAHGGTIMAILSALCGDEGSYYSWRAGNCEGYRFLVNAQAPGNASLLSQPLAFTRLTDIFES